MTLVWFEGQQQERRRRQEVLVALEVARQELSGHIEVIRKKERRLAAIHEVSTVVSESLDVSQTLDQVLDKVLQVTGADAGMIFLSREKTRQLELAAHRGLSDACVEAIAILTIGEGFNGKVAATGQPMVIADVSCEAIPHAKEVESEGITSQVIVPLRSKDRIIGTLCAATRSQREFSREEMELLTAIGSQVGVAIENARLYREVRLSEANYRDLFENASAAMYIHDLAGNIIAANNAFSRLTGYERDELIGSSVMKLRSPATSSGIQEIEDRLLRGELVEQPHETCLVRKDGTECIVSLSTRVVHEDGQPRGFEHVATDVTAQKRMRESVDFYLRQTITAQEEERKRISRELHDETAQSMLLISQRLDSLATDSKMNLRPEAARYLAEVRGIALRAMADMRRLTQDLRPRILDDLGLVAALEWLTDDLERQSSIRADVRAVGVEKSLAPEVQLLAFRIA